MSTIHASQPERGRFNHDVYGEIQRNTATGRYRVTWSQWFKSAQMWDRPNSGNIFVGPGIGFKIRGVREFRSLRRALKHYHYVMAYADEVAAYAAEKSRANREDWVSL